MKDITKTEPAFYTEFVKKNNPVHWDDIAPIREQLREHMLSNEQNNLCAYTELSLQSNNSSSHVDHFKRQGLFPTERFNYTNLFTADKHPEYGAAHKDKTVVQAEYSNLLHPCLDNLEGRFKYQEGSGEIEPQDATDIKAEFTITAFNLNHKILREKRLSFVELIRMYKNQFTVDETIAILGQFDSLVRYIYTNEYN